MLSFTLKCSHWDVFSFVMCFCCLCNSIAVYQSKIHFKLEAIYHFLVVVRPEFHSGYSLQRTWKNAQKVVTWNLCFSLTWLLDITGLVFTPQMNLYPSSSLACISFHIFFIKFALVIDKIHLPCRALCLYLVCMQTDFLFCLHFDTWFPDGPTKSQGWGLHSSLFLLNAQNISDAHARLRITVPEVIGWTKWTSPQNRCSLLWLHITSTKRAIKIQEYPCPVFCPEESL